MNQNKQARVALLFPGDSEARKNIKLDNNRFAHVFAAFQAAGIHAEPAVYHDDFCDDVRQQLSQVDAVLVWVNPIEDGRDRSVLDAMLREVAKSGVFVSAHPDIILKMGTKDVLYTTRALSWSTDTKRYKTLAELKESLGLELSNGETRVLKQYRGHSGIGVWKVELADKTNLNQTQVKVDSSSLLRVRHASRGSFEEVVTLEAFYARCEVYFESGIMIDQAFQSRLPEGMVRCYLVQDKVAGFGHQAINALYPLAEGTPFTETPQPGQRLYHSADLTDYQGLKHQLETDWLPSMQALLNIDTLSLPILWDVDFLLGPKTEEGEDSYILCEINVSSVSPFPDSALKPMTESILNQLRQVMSRLAE